MSKIPKLPIADLQHVVARAIQIAQNERPEQLQAWLSFTEYLKDARRWQYVKDNHIVVEQDLSADEFEKHIDNLINGEASDA